MLKTPEQFIKAGKATFTVRNSETGNRFTFKVVQAKDENNNQGDMFGGRKDRKPLWFVSVLSGTNNESDYRYIGIINKNTFLHTKKSKVTEQALSFRAFKWIWEHIKNLPENVEVHHEGRCGRCGRKLTVPESIESGFGPECIGKL